MKIKIKRDGQKAEVLTVKNRGTAFIFTESKLTISQPGVPLIERPFNLEKDQLIVPVK